MAQWLIGYAIFLFWLFAACAVTLGLKTTLWGFALTHLGCALAVVALWWYDERRWGRTAGVEDLTPTTAREPAILALAPQPTLMQQESGPAADCLSLKDEEFELLESYTETLTERVSGLYPLVAREHVHKIVWTVMIELFCKRIVESADANPAAILAARLSKAA
ncbi:MAG: hypothetical protein HYZ72_16570 [Deltaproteobacteria bacterium]|nr:hypothetical protein [Deltaproteobacteria bacterium]